MKPSTNTMMSPNMWLKKTPKGLELRHTCRLHVVEREIDHSSFKCCTKESVSVLFRRGRLE